MKIEPCPFCGVNLVRLHYNEADGWPEWVECANCHAEGDKRALKQDAIDSWNRLSRIVRAAEKWAKAVRFEEEATSGKRCVPSKIQLDAQDWVTEAEDALLVAVEGGAE